jgi:hypothetical protein
VRIEWNLKNREILVNHLNDLMTEFPFDDRFKFIQDCFVSQQILLDFLMAKHTVESKNVPKQH